MMKLWQFPAKKWDSWQVRRYQWSRGAELIKELTGIEPCGRIQDGSFAFLTETPREKFPDWLQMSAIGLVRPRWASTKGRAALAAWESAQVPGVTVFDFYTHFFGAPVADWNHYELEEIGGNTYLKLAEGIDPSEHGFKLVIMP